jgi:hypothetical protein
MEDEMGRTLASMGRRRIHIRFPWESQKERDHFEVVNANGMITLRWIFEK